MLCFNCIYVTLHYPLLGHITLCYTPLHLSTLRALRCATLHYIAPYYITLCYITLHYMHTYNILSWKCVPHHHFPTCSQLPGPGEELKELHPRAWSSAGGRAILRTLKKPLKQCSMVYLLYGGGRSLLRTLLEHSFSLRLN